MKQYPYHDPNDLPEPENEDPGVPDDPDVLNNELLNRTLMNEFDSPAIPEVGMRSVLDALNGTEGISELHKRAEYYDPDDYLWGGARFGKL